MGMMESILESITCDWHKKELRCIILSAKGNVWSAGHNLKELISANKNKQIEVFQKLSDIILNIHKAPVPVIAKVNGLAAAAGCQLVASCDIVIASEKSTFSTPGYLIKYVILFYFLISKHFILELILECFVLHLELQYPVIYLDLNLLIC